MSKVRFRISSLGLARWRHHVQELLLQHILTQWDWETGTRPCDTQICAIPKSILNQLERYERMETESLMELVAWKVNCLILDGSGHFDSMQEIVDQWALDDDFDPVEYKRQRRLPSNVGVILTSVSAFLW
ncbi:unnamed protein product [Cylindrotheca closterium]|uniref:Uncharacterized protein n=1 Tax=Cylindrotheca closterium TaxID=2856 RepID=A0AAD2JJ40_9STRA|nr:unnamed protein product [Cylindrotheca closterium]